MEQLLSRAVEPHTASSRLTALLGRYRPQGDDETADLRRVQTLAETGGDPWLRDLPLHVTASALIVHPSSARVLLRWLSLTEAHEATSEANLLESLARLERLLAGDIGAAGDAY